MRRLLLPLALLALLALLAGALAQDEDALFDSGDLFGDELVRDADEGAEGEPADPAGDLLAGEAIAIGGRYRLEARAGVRVVDGEAEFESGVADLGAQIFLDARPSRDFRVFVEGDLAYGTADGVDFALDELFADVDVADAVFLRAGKQTINWGVGYFYSPANLVNVERIDPEDPEEELAGPVALKAQVPLGVNNLTAYAILEDVGGGNHLGGAARYEFLVEGFEVTTGIFVEDDGDVALMATGTGAVEGITLFGELVVELGTDRTFVVRDAGAPGGLGLEDSDALFVSGTLGARASYSTDDERLTLSGVAQYFFNGDGYADPGILTDDPAAVARLLASGALAPGDLRERGRHYLGASLAATELYDLDLAPSILALANLSDGSGFASLGVGYRLNDHVTPHLDYRYAFGPVGSEYAFGGGVHSLSLGVSVTGRF